MYLASIPNYCITMLRTYLLSGAVVAQGVITDVDAATIMQFTLLAPSLAEAKERLLGAFEPADVAQFQFTDQCREICENDIVQSPFEGWLATA